MKEFSLYEKSIDFSLTIDKESINEGESFKVTLTASGKDAVKGFKIPYRIGGKDKGGIIRISPYDFNKKEEFGLFELDSNLQANVEITINKDIFIEQKEICYVSLVLRPEVFVEVLVNDTSPPLPPIPETIPKKDPKIVITPLQSFVKEGEIATFLVTYEGIQDGHPFEYLYYDSKDFTENSAKFRVDEKIGSTIINIKVDFTDVGNSLSRILTIRLKKYPRVHARVIIQNTEIVGNTIEGLYKPGEYSLRLPRRIVYKVILVAGGGGAGGSVVYGDRALDSINGLSGGSSFIYRTDTLEQISKVEGGSGGERGWWDNGSYWYGGSAGEGGIAFSYDMNPLVKHVQSVVNGRKGYSQKYLEDGAPSVSPMSNYGQGGERGIGRGNGDDGYAGSGGSGASSVIYIQNKTEDSIDLLLKVGGGGIGGLSDRSKSQGSEGTPGICIITRSD